MPSEAWLIAHMQGKKHLHCVTKVSCEQRERDWEMGVLWDLSVLTALAKAIFHTLSYCAQSSVSLSTQ